MCTNRCLLNCGDKRAYQEMNRAKYVKCPVSQISSKAKCIIQDICLPFTASSSCLSSTTKVMLALLEPFLVTLCVIQYTPNLQLLTVQHQKPREMKMKRCYAVCSLGKHSVRTNLQCIFFLSDFLSEVYVGFMICKCG